MPPIDRLVKLDLLQHTPLFASLRPAELETLTALVAERRFAAGAVVMRRGDPGVSLMLLAKGRLRIGAVSAEGRDVTLALIEPGAVIGEVALLDGKPRSADVIAMQDSTVLVLDRRDFLSVLRRNEDMMMRLLALLCDRLRETSGALEDIALLDLPARLAKLLVKLGREYGRPAPDGLRLHVKLSQSELGTLVATTRESINKQLRLWRDDGVLADQDGHLIIRRPEVLKALCE